VAGGQIFICSLAKVNRQSSPAMLSPSSATTMIIHCFGFTVRKLGVKNKQNCYNADQVFSLVAASGEQELTKNYKVNTILFVAFCSLYVPK